MRHHPWESVFPRESDALCFNTYRQQRLACQRWLCTLAQASRYIFTTCGVTQTKFPRNLCTERASCNRQSAPPATLHKTAQSVLMLFRLEEISHVDIKSGSFVDRLLL